MMKDRNQWECEIRARQKYELDSCVVKLLGWHVPEDEDTISGDDSHPEPSDPRSKYKYLLILERGEISGHRAISTQRIAGFNVDAVTNLSKEIAQKCSRASQRGSCSLRSETS